MDKTIFYNQMHVDKENLQQIYLDLEVALANHIKDFHSKEDQFVIGTSIYGAASLRVLQVSSASLTLQISGGVAYDSWERIESNSTQSYTISDIPGNLGGGLNVTRIDLLSINKTTIETSPFSIDFIGTNRNIYQETKNTRLLDNYEFQITTGAYNVGGGIKPSIPAGVVPLAYIHLRDETNKIYNSDTSSLNEGFIEDARNLLSF